MFVFIDQCSKVETSEQSLNQTHITMHDKLQLEEGNGIYIFKQTKRNPSDYESLRDLEFAFVR